MKEQKENINKLIASYEAFYFLKLILFRNRKED